LNKDSEGSLLAGRSTGRVVGGRGRYLRCSSGPGNGNLVLVKNKVKYGIKIQSLERKRLKRCILLLKFI